MKEMLDTYLPKEINIDKYELDKIEEEENREKYAPFSWMKKIYLIEINIKPKWYENNNFITHDVWTRHWKDYKYSQENLMDRLHDFDSESVLNWDKRLIVLKR